MTSVFVWTIGDIGGLVAFGIFLLGWLLIIVTSLFKQIACKHDGKISETQACDAICNLCGKNLGFIGNIRDKK